MVKVKEFISIERHLINKITRYGLQIPNVDIKSMVEFEPNLLIHLHINGQTKEGI